MDWAASSFRIQKREVRDDRKQGNAKCHRKTNSLKDKEVEEYDKTEKSSFIMRAKRTYMGEAMQVLHLCVQSAQSGFESTGEVFSLLCCSTKRSETIEACT